MFILKKFAWKPILNMLSEREQNIAEALNTAKKAREEMAALKADNERLLHHC
jgi:F-type H+-transporting ATPase subunit b